MGFVNAHFVAYSTDLGASSVQAAFGLSTVGIAGLVGGVTFGYLADRFGRRTLLSLAYLMRGIGYTILLASSGLIPAIFGIIIIGTSWTSVISLTATVTSDEYGLRRLGTIYGTMFAVMPFGASASVWLAGYIYDTNGNYDMALWISLLAAIIAALAIAVPNKRTSRKIWKLFVNHR